ncbi:fimbrial protein YehD [Citrobacter freundii]|nr:fimbrial protein YehD [Citrobacter freundii]
MKRSIISAAVLSAVFMSAGAFAAVDTGTLTIKGLVLPASCSIVNEQNSSTIILPDVSLEAINNLGLGQQLDGVSNASAATKIKFKCEGKNHPSISFNESGFDGSYKDVTKNTSNEADGIGFKIYLQNARSDGQATTPIQPGESVKLAQESSGIYELDFKAYYARTKSVVASGEVQSTITMQVSSD